MAGKLKVHVDQDKCQGHARCKALAPELFDLDEFGNAHEAGDGSVPAGTRGQGLARKIQLSGDRDRRHRGVNRFAPSACDFKRTNRGNYADVRSRPRNSRFRPRRIDRSPAGHRLDPRFRPYRSAVDRRSVSDLGRAARGIAGDSYRPLPRLLHADHLSGGEGDRLRHRAFLVAPGDRARHPAGEPATPRRRSRPIRRSTSRPSNCCCRRSRPTP